MKTSLENKKLFLQYGYENKDNISPWSAHRLYRAAFMMAADEPCDDEDFDAALREINYRNDCCDFQMLVLLRLLYLYQDSGLMSQKLLDRLKAAILDFDYWLSERSKYACNKIIWTENHVMCYHTAEYLAAQLFPDEHFRTRDLTGREIIPISKAQILDWIQIKGRVGFSEWDSDTYAGINMETLLMLYDLAEDAEIRAQSEKLLNIMFLSLAFNCHKGMYCCTHGRAYADAIKDDTRATIYPLLCLVWNVAPVPSDRSTNFSAFCYATGRFEPDPLITSIYHEITELECFENFEQESFDVEDAHLFGKGYEDEEDLTLFWHNMAYDHRLILENMLKLEQKYQICVNPHPFMAIRYIERCKEKGIEPQEIFSHNYMRRVNKVNYKTKDYMLSTAQDFRKGGGGFQQHIWQASLDGRAVVFVTHPGALNEGQSRPDFWSGNAYMPKAVQYKNVCISVYKQDDPYALAFTHAYFPKKEFDEVTECGNWIFARKNDGYVALYSQNGYYHSERSGFQDCELVCDGKENIWICQMGNQKEYGSFQTFVSRVLGSNVQFDGDCVSYNSPHGVLRVGWEQDFTCDGKQITIANYKRFDNPYCTSEYGSGVYQLQCNGKTMQIEF